jgi:hypothetical protein
LYLNLLPRLNSKTIKLLDHSRSINQICSLERRTARGSNDTVDHPKNGHDDLANVIAGVCYAIANVKVQDPPMTFTWDGRRVINGRILEKGQSPHAWDGPLPSGGYATSR